VKEVRTGDVRSDGKTISSRDGGEFRNHLLNPVGWLGRRPQPPDRRLQRAATWVRLPGAAYIRLAVIERIEEDEWRKGVK
jgi:hypothetical protein